MHYKSKHSEYQSRAGVMASCSEAVTSDLLACLASLAENKFKLPDYPGHDGEVTSINEVAKPEIFSVFRVLSG
jgi:hypothetical protein